VLCYSNDLWYANRVPGSEPNRIRDDWTPVPWQLITRHNMSAWKDSGTDSLTMPSTQTVAFEQNPDRLNQEHTQTQNTWWLCKPFPLTLFKRGAGSFLRTNLWKGEQMWWESKSAEFIGHLLCLMHLKSAWWNRIYDLAFSSLLWLLGLLVVVRYCCDVMRLTGRFTFAPGKRVKNDIFKCFIFLWKKIHALK